jgi:hypothetical protein
VPGARISVGRRGVVGTVGVPGTGLGYSTRLDKPRGRSAAAAETPAWPDESAGIFALPGAAPVPAPPGRAPTGFDVERVESAALEFLNSPALRELRDMIVAARTQLVEVIGEHRVAEQQRDRLSTEFDRKSRSIFRVFMRRRLRRLERALLPRAAAEVERLAEWREASRVTAQFHSSEAAAKGWDRLVLAFDTLMQSQAVWDVTAGRSTDRARERTAANRSVDRQPVRLGWASHAAVAFEGRALQFDNANGSDLVFYPGVLLLERADGALALVDLHDPLAACPAQADFRWLRGGGRAPAGPCAGQQSAQFGRRRRRGGCRGSSSWAICPRGAGRA